MGKSKDLFQQARERTELLQNTGDLAGTVEAATGIFPQMHGAGKPKESKIDKLEKKLDALIKLLGKSEEVETILKLGDDE